MMRNIAIGLAAATIAIGGSALSASALYGQESGIGKGMSKTGEVIKKGGDKLEDASRPAPGTK